MIRDFWKWISLCRGAQGWAGATKPLLDPVIPESAKRLSGIQKLINWIPVSTGMTKYVDTISLHRKQCFLCVLGVLAVFFYNAKFFTSCRSFSFKNRADVKLKKYHHSFPFQVSSQA